jgi:hypothetical protein
MINDLISENFGFKKNSIEKRKTLWVHFFPKSHDNICLKLHVNVYKYMNFVFNNTKIFKSLKDTHDVAENMIIISWQCKIILHYCLYILFFLINYNNFAKNELIYVVRVLSSLI